MWTLTLTGYGHPAYARSLSEFGVPIELTRSGAWILRRRIPESSLYDAMGCYPIFCCSDWSQLSHDIEEIGTSLVSLSAVPDPFGAYDALLLHECFRDVIRPFKDHFVTDLSRTPRSFLSHHHQRYAQKALTRVEVEICEDPTSFAEEWVTLYAGLIRRHGIKGIRTFSETSLARQLKVPGSIIFRAFVEGATVGMTLWYVQGEVGFYHLGAYTDLGYSLEASYAIFWYAIQFFAEKLRWLDLGGSAGVNPSSTDGLAQFKRGWATGTRQAYFCGRILDRRKYYETVKAKGYPPTSFFPAYRDGEFG